MSLVSVPTVHMRINHCLLICCFLYLLSKEPLLISSNTSGWLMIGTQREGALE
jgi:hypothetical protein